MNIYDYSVMNARGELICLREFYSSTLLIVNTATECGFSRQLKELERLYLKYKDQGLLVLAFPCNQFHEQSPGTNLEIEDICRKKFKTSFPIFSKIDVNGKNASPLYQYLKHQQPGIISENIKWNFTKFLVNKNGDVIKRYAPITKMQVIEQDIRYLLEKNDMLSFK